MSRSGRRNVGLRFPIAAAKPRAELLGDVLYSMIVAEAGDVQARHRSILRHHEDASQQLGGDAMVLPSRFDRNRHLTQDRKATVRYVHLRATAQHAGLEEPDDHGPKPVETPAVLLHGLIAHRAHEAQRAFIAAEACKMAAERGGFMGEELSIGTHAPMVLRTAGPHKQNKSGQCIVYFTRHVLVAGVAQLAGALRES